MVARGHVRIDRKISLARPEEINRSIQESTRALISPEGWKLCLRDYDKNELYNLHSDPHERQNLFYRAESHEMIACLSNAIYRWQENSGDMLKGIRSGINLPPRTG